MIKLQTEPAAMPHSADPGLHARVTALFEDEAAAQEWLATPNALFGGQAPETLLAGKAESRGALVEFLARAEAGDFS